MIEWSSYDTLFKERLFQPELKSACMEKSTLVGVLMMEFGIDRTLRPVNF